MIEQTAKDFTFLQKRPDLKGSSGWLQRFKEHHSIVGHTVSNESHAMKVSSVHK